MAVRRAAGLVNDTRARGRLPDCPPVVADRRVHDPAAGPETTARVPDEYAGRGPQVPLGSLGPLPA